MLEEPIDYTSKLAEEHNQRLLDNPPEKKPIAGCDTCQKMVDRVKNSLSENGLKGINSDKRQLDPRNQVMARKTNEVLAAYGGGFVSKGVSIGLAEVDVKLHTDRSTGTSPLKRVQTWGNLLLGLGAGIAAAYSGSKMDEATFDFALGFGVVQATELIEPVEEVVLGKVLTYGSPAPTPMMLPAHVPRYSYSGVGVTVPAPAKARGFRP